MWKTVKHPSKIANVFEVSDRGEIRFKSNKSPKNILTDTHGYHVIIYKGTEYKVHRLIADTFIARVKGFEVHHINRIRNDNNVRNLMVCTRSEHRRLHATTEKPVIQINKGHKKGMTLLDAATVHRICELLEKDYSYPKIREKLGIYVVSDDAIGKIAIGKNWPEISKLYNIQVSKRSCMGSYSDRCIEIAILMNRGYRVKEIARKMGIDVKNNTDYQRLFKAAKRYQEWMLDGKWGLIKRSYADSIEKRIMGRINT